LEEDSNFIFIGFATKLLHAFTKFSQRNGIRSALIENAEDALGEKRLVGIIEGSKMNQNK
jgi:hypothetical protein